MKPILLQAYPDGYYDSFLEKGWAGLFGLTAVFSVIALWRYVIQLNKKREEDNRATIKLFQDTLKERDITREEQMNVILKQQQEIANLQQGLDIQSKEIESCYKRLMDEMNAVKNLSVQLTELLHKLEQGDNPAISNKRKPPTKPRGGGA